MPINASMHLHKTNKTNTQIKTNLSMFNLACIIILFDPTASIPEHFTSKIVIENVIPIQSVNWMT